MKIYLNILGFKNFEDEELEKIFNELEEIKLNFNSIFNEPLSELKRKVSMEKNKRERRKWVWVEFISYWSGYTSNQRKITGKFYRKIDRDIAEKMPKFYCHNFTDNTTNDWYIKIVSVKGKDEGSYSSQIDEFLKTLK